MNRYTAKYNEVADRILDSVEVHMDFPLPTQKRPLQNADEGITAHTISPGICEPESRRKRAKKAKVDRTKPQVTPDPQSFGALMEKSFDADAAHVTSTKAPNIPQPSTPGEMPVMMEGHEPASRMFEHGNTSCLSFSQCTERLTESQSRQAG